MSSRLIQLPDGNWVDPISVVAVFAVPGGRAPANGPCPPNLARPRVRILMADELGDHSIICKDDESAKAVRDTIARLVMGVEKSWGSNGTEVKRDSR